MHVAQIAAITASLVGVIVGLVYYLQLSSGDESYLLKSKWSLTVADGSLPQTWYLDTTSNAIRIESYPASDAGTVIVEEFVGDKKYTYFSPDVSKLSVDADEYCSTATGYDGDCATVAAELTADVESMAAAWAGNKAGCVVEDAAVTVSAVKTVSDGNLEVAGFFVLMVDGVPTSIVDAESDEIIATIDSIEDWSEDISVVGCSAEDDMSGDESRRLGFYEAIAEGRERRRNLSEDNEEVEKARNYLNGLYLDMAGKNDEAEDAQRMLSATAFQAWASNTKWCGAGTDLAGTPCPGTTGGDTQADYACHRHDHGKKADGIIGGMAVRLGCDIDKGLADRTSNWAAQAIFGKWGIAMAWGCYDTGSYSCWKWKSKWWGGYWSHGNYCSGEHTHYGPWRYSSYSHSYGWKSQSRCSTGLPWCTGCI
mmetsp:Transcript_12856/g.23527  ORF Transcript_12856/g.23527 Transcript_12856/m.23527 type:complete len:424 (+) Transcript_12856:40-1311(+)